MFSVAVERHGGLLRIKGQGEAVFADLLALVEMIAAITGKEGQRRVLVDLLDVHTSLSFTDHLQLGGYVAQQLRAMERVASVVPERYRTGTSEKAAQKAGLQLRTFTVLQEGRAWVLEPAG